MCDIDLKKEFKKLVLHILLYLIIMTVFALCVFFVFPYSWAYNIGGDNCATAYFMLALYALLFVVVEGICCIVREIYTYIKLRSNMKRDLYYMNHEV